MRNAAILEQPDDRRQTHGETSGVEEMSILFFGHGDALEHENDSAAGGADVDRLVGGIEHQHGGVENVDFALGASVFEVRDGHAGRQSVSPRHAQRRIVPLA